ncbi:MAG: PQQ-binding-like beta-propeller repeat protein, partial [candidate division WOR-3 bacterium]
MMSFFILMGVSAVIPEGWPMFRYDQARTGFCPATADFSSRPQAKAEWMVWSEEDNIYASPVGADFGGDGWHDVLIGSYGKTASYPLADVYCGNNGALIWASSTYTSQGCYLGGPALMDVTGDNRPEVFVPNIQAGALYALNGADGSKLWEVPIGTDRYSSPLVRENGPEGRVYVCNDDGTLFCLNATTGATMWTYTPDLGGTCYSSPSAGDVNSDGQDEIVYSCGSEIHVVSLGGVELWSVSAGDASLSTVALSDRNGDGTREMWLYCNQTGRIKVFEYGNPAPVVNVFIGSASLVCPPPPAVADVNADGVPDAVAHHSDGLTMVDGANGALAWNVSAQDLYGPVIIANLDPDPYLEIVATGRPPILYRCKVEMYQENGSLAWQWWTPSPLANDEVEGEAILINVDADPEYEIAAVDYSCWAVVLDNSPLQTEE